MTYDQFLVYLLVGSCIGTLLSTFFMAYCSKECTHSSTQTLEIITLTLVLASAAFALKIACRKQHRLTILDNGIGSAY